MPGIEKAHFTFELPPRTENERGNPQARQVSETVKNTKSSVGKPIVNGVSSKLDGPQFFQKPSITDKPPPYSPITKPRQIPSGHQRDLHSRRDHELVDSRNFTIVTKEETIDKPLIRKSLPSKPQMYTYHIDTQAPPKQEPQLSQSFPSIPSDRDLILPPSSETPSHRRTKSSIATPTRSSRRTKFTGTYAEDSHREFIRDLRDLLGQRKAKKDQEEKEIDEQIRKLREEGKAVEKSLAGEIPRLPELLARKVRPPLFRNFSFELG